MTEQRKPVVAVTVGDPAGVGPEIVAKALTHEAVWQVCLPVVVGDLAVFRRAAEAVGLKRRLRRVSPVDLEAEADEIPVLDIQSGGERAEIGKISAEGGRAAFGAIRMAVDLCLEGRATALATAPINKESLRLADVPYLDHTEALKKLTKAASVFTLFVTDALRVFFFTRHLPFREIADQIKREPLVQFTAEACEQLSRLGFPEPRVAVAALNPHGGEGGMFGREEIEEIAPAVEALRARGYNVSGPIPADSVFHLAKEGQYDAVISLYHDQGHIATKTLDFYRTVSLTLGLPFLRTSVDHGTAFDIAGTGKANEISMVEAILAAAKFGPLWKGPASGRSKEGP